jgi:hypothetical protein
VRWTVPVVAWGLAGCEVLFPLSGGGDGTPDAPPLPLDGDPLDEDDDDDTVLDVDDNCPQVANLNQHDEDGDMLGDVCDPCPIDPDNQDSDNDAVGGPCDPDATQHRIIAFYPFDSLPADFITTNVWQLENDALVHPGTVLMEHFAYRDEALEGPIRVHTAFTVNGYNPLSGNYHALRLRFQSHVNGTIDRPGYACEIFDFNMGMPPNDHVLQATRYPIPEQNQRMSLPSSGWDLGARYAIAGTFDGVDVLACNAAVPGEALATSMFVNQPIFEPGVVGITAFGLNVAVHYLLIVGPRD